MPTQLGLGEERSHLTANELLPIVLRKIASRKARKDTPLVASIMPTPNGLGEERSHLTSNKLLLKVFRKIASRKARKDTPLAAP